MQKSTSDMHSIRVWNWLDVQEVKKHLLLIEDLYGMCANCKQIGLNYLKDRKCPGCKTEFRYLATRMKSPGEVAKILSRIRSESIPVTVIDREDFERASAREALGGLFS